MDAWEYEEKARDFLDMIPGALYTNDMLVARALVYAVLACRAELAMTRMTGE